MEINYSPFSDQPIKGQLPQSDMNTAIRTVIQDVLTRYFLSSYPDLQATLPAMIQDLTAALTGKNPEPSAPPMEPGMKVPTAPPLAPSTNAAPAVPQAPSPQAPTLQTPPQNAQAVRVAFGNPPPANPSPNIPASPQLAQRTNSAAANYSPSYPSPKEPVIQNATVSVKQAESFQQKEQKSSETKSSESKKPTEPQNQKEASTPIPSVDLIEKIIELIEADGIIIEIANEERTADEVDAHSQKEQSDDSPISNPNETKSSEKESTKPRSTSESSTSSKKETEKVQSSQETKPKENSPILEKTITSMISNSASPASQQENASFSPSLPMQTGETKSDAMQQTNQPITTTSAPQSNPSPGLNSQSTSKSALPNLPPHPAKTEAPITMIPNVSAQPSQIPAPQPMPTSSTAPQLSTTGAPQQAPNPTPSSPAPAAIQAPVNQAALPSKTETPLNAVVQPTPQAGKGETNPSKPNANNAIAPYSASSQIQTTPGSSRRSSTRPVDAVEEEEGEEEEEEGEEEEENEEEDEN
ncbi:MAG: hypothetical protein K1X28_03270 [Parachlamydiales bacterium]|nr:hypothetical protein [Parachlamydiales bacterium]